MNALKVWSTFIIILILMLITEKTGYVFLNGMICGLCAYTTADKWFGRN